jgi:hypothetical protein
VSKTTKRYPYTRQQADEQIAQAVQSCGPNQARGELSYRRGGKDGKAVRECDGLVVFSFVASPRTPGAYRRIAYAS